MKQLVAAEQNGGRSAAPSLKKLLDRTWCETNPEWLEIFNNDLFGYYPDDDIVKWVYFLLLDSTDLNFAMHKWCIDNCRGRFYTYDDPHSHPYVTFQNPNDAVLFKLTYYDVIAHTTDLF